MKLLFYFKMILMAIVSTSFLYMESYVFEAWHVYHRESDQHIILLSDYHDPSPESTSQRLALLKEAKMLHALLLVEDQTFLFQYICPKKIIAYQPCLQPIINELINDPINFDPNKQYSHDLSSLDPATEGDSTPLYLLTHMARIAGINAQSIECRQAEIISSLGGPISAAQVCLCYDKLIDDVQHYNDILFNQYYASRLASYYKYCQLLEPFFAYLRSCTQNIQAALCNTAFYPIATKTNRIMEKDYWTSYFVRQGMLRHDAEKNADEISNQQAQDDNPYENIIRNLYLFLVDIQILHKIAQGTGEGPIIVYAGGSHIESVMEVLLNMGYRIVRHAGTAFYQPIDLEDYFSLTSATLATVSAEHYHVHSACSLLNLYIMEFESTTTGSIYRQNTNFLLRS